MIEELFKVLKGAVLKDPTSDELENLLELANFYSADTSRLRRDLENLVKERLLMHLIGDVPTHLNFGERLQFVARRLQTLSMASDKYQPTSSAVEVVALTTIQQAVAGALSESKDGVAGLDERLALDLIQLQGHRCAVCGMPLRAHVRKNSPRFSDGFEPIAENLHLDHILPYYFLGNEGGRRILCGGCNTLKNDRIGVQEDGFVISGNHVRTRDRASIRRRMVYWALEHSRKCEDPECTVTPSTGILLVESFRRDVPFMHGNLAVRCDSHGSNKAVWVHE